MKVLICFCAVLCLITSCRKSEDAEKEFRRIGLLDVFGIKFGVDPKDSSKDKALDKRLSSGKEKLPKPFSIFVQPKTKPPIDVEKALSDVSQKMIPKVVNIKAELSYAKIVEKIEKYLPKGYGDALKDYDIKNEGGKKLEENFNYGSGFIVSWDGYIATNAHVVDGAKKITVTVSDKKKFNANIVGIDRISDIAVIKIQPDKALEPVRFADSSLMKVGQMTIAIGNQRGENSTVFSAIVSAVPTRSLSVSSQDDFIQITSPIYTSCSGGPLLDLEGYVIGMNTSKIKKEMGGGLAIPSVLVKNIVSQLINEGKVIRSWLGTKFQKLTPELSKSFKYEKKNGLLITELLENSPATAAELKAGDILYKFEDHDIIDLDHFNRVISLTPFGSEVKIKLIREGELLEKNIVLNKEKAEVKEKIKMISTKHEWIGLSLGERSIVSADGKTVEKVLFVRSVAKMSPAYQAGVRRDDAILALDAKKLVLSSDYEKYIDDLDEDEEFFRVLLRRKEKGKAYNRFVVIHRKKEKEEED